VKVPRLSRRKFILTALLAAPAAFAADTVWLEPTWLKTRHLRLRHGTPSHRLVHFTDLHHKGDTKYLKSVIAHINAQKPDLVCFTGDLVEEEKFLAETLKYLAGIKAPLYGVPGNHDYWSKVSFEPIRECFQATGGDWLLDAQLRIPDSRLNLIGITCNHATQATIPLDPSLTNILLMHYPAWVNHLNGQKFDLLLAGHSHGGQVRIPFFGAIIVPFATERYDMGLYETASGPLYVNPGIGYIYGYNFRFNCRPEITVIEI